jgi:peptidoglycan/xylan/chitin deacetylase (PgdA/CDA1 family)
LAKKLTVGLADTKAGRGLLLPGSGQRVPVFMLHRFRDGVTRPSGHDPEMLAAALDYLKRHDFRVLSVDEIVGGLAAGALPDRVVSFTIDDGYEDQGRIGAEVFLAHGCPATIYLVTGMIDGAYWPWEARVAYLFSHAEEAFTFEHAGAEYLSSGMNDEHSTNNRRALVRAMKRLPLSSAEREVKRLAEVVGVSLPRQPPEDFRPLTWDQVASLEQRGISFGAHTVSHPTLAAEDDSVAKREIEASTARIRDKLARPSSVFCYPTGRYEDFGPREIALAKAAGYSAALSSEPGYCTLDGTPDACFELHRFGFPDNLEDFKAIVLQLLRFRRWNRRDERA